MERVDASQFELGVRLLRTPRLGNTIAPLGTRCRRYR